MRFTDCLKTGASPPQEVTKGYQRSKELRKQLRPILNLCFQVGDGFVTVSEVTHSIKDGICDFDALAKRVRAQFKLLVIRGVLIQPGNGLYRISRLMTEEDTHFIRKPPENKRHVAFRPPLEQVGKS